MHDNNKIALITPSREMFEFYLWTHINKKYWSDYVWVHDIDSASKYMYDGVVFGTRHEDVSGLVRKIVLVNLSTLFRLYE